MKPNNKPPSIPPNGGQQIDKSQVKKPTLRQISESKAKKDIYLLTVYVRKAIGLKNVELLNKSDAFVQVEFRGRFYETPIVRNNLEPWFNQSFQYIIELTQGGGARDPVLDEFVKLRVFDHNQVFANQLIGCCYFRVGNVKEIFNGGHGTEGHLISEEAMKQAISQNLDHSNQYWKEMMDVNQQTSQELGKLGVYSTLKQVNRQSEVQMPTKEIMDVLDKQSRNNLVKRVVKQYQEYSDGVLKVLINQIYNLPEPIDSQFEIEFKVKTPLLGLKGSGQRIKVNSKLQCYDPQFLPIDSKLTESQLIVDFYKVKMGGLSKDKLGTFEYSFSNSQELLVPGKNNPLLIQLDFNQLPSTKAQYGDLNLVKPLQLILTLAFSESLFTQMPQGDLQIQVNSWSFNGSAIHTGHYLLFKLDSQSVWRSNQLVQVERLYEPFKISLTGVKNMLENLNVSVVKEIAVMKDEVICSADIKLYELFNVNYDFPMSLNLPFFTSIHRVDIIDIAKQLRFQLSLASKFSPSALIPQQLEQLRELHQQYLSEREKDAVEAGIEIQKQGPMLPQGNQQLEELKDNEPIFSDDVQPTPPQILSPSGDMAAIQTYLEEEIGQQDIQDRSQIQDLPNNRLNPNANDPQMANILSKMNGRQTDPSPKQNTKQREKRVQQPSARDQIAQQQQQPKQDDYTSRDELASLPITTPPLFTDHPRGLLMLRLKQLVLGLKDKENKLQKQAVPDVQKCYLVIKTSKMSFRSKSMLADLNGMGQNLFDQVISIKVGAKNEEIEIKLFKESDNGSDVMLAEGTYPVSSLIKSSWKKVSSDLILQIPKINPLLTICPSLAVDLSYRISKFIKMPRGRLELEFSKLEEFTKISPVFEIRLGNQRISMGQIQHEKIIEIETQNQWDTLEIRFFEETLPIENLKNKKNIIGSADNQTIKSIKLLGAYFKNLSSIYFDEPHYCFQKIDLSSVDNQMKGKLGINFKFQPHFNLQDSSDLQKSSDESALNRQDSLKQGQAYISLLQMQVLGIDQGQSYNVENVRLELNYGSQRCLSRVTTDLMKTQNRELMNDNFRFIIKEDLGRGESASESQITIRALDLDFALFQDEKMREQVIGSSFISTQMMRQNHGEVMQYQCSIKIDQKHILRKIRAIKFEQGGLEKMLSDQVEEEVANFGEILRELKDINDSASGIKVAESIDQKIGLKQQPELVLTFQIFYMTTQFTRAPIGLLALQDLTLINLDQFIQDSKLPAKAGYGVSVEFELNKIKNQTELGQIVRPIDQSPSNTVNKEQICLFDHQYDPTDVIRMGRTCYIRQGQMIAKSFLKWSKQLVMHSSSPSDELKIKVLLKLPCPEPDNPDEVYVIGLTTLNIADVSYFLQQPENKKYPDASPISIALLMDYQECNQLRRNLFPFGNQQKRDGLKNRVLMGNRDLTNSCYGRSLVLLLDLKFAINEAFEDAKQFDGLLHQDNIYVMPKEVKYEDYIEHGYDSIVKKKLGPKNQLKIEKKTTEKEVEGKNKQVLIEVQVKNLNSILRGINSSGSQIRCFTAIEPLQGKDSLRTYVQSVIDGVTDAAHYKSTNTQQVSFDPEQQKMDIMKRIRAMGYGEKLIQGEFIAMPEDLVRPGTQISSRTFTITDFEIHPINNRLEVWIPQDAKRLVLSLAVQIQDQSGDIELFKSYLVSKGLSKEKNLLCIHRLATSGLLPDIAGKVFEKVQVYQCLVDLDYDSESSASPFYSLSQEKVFLQQCNLAELAFQGKANHLLTSPQPLSQALIRTKIQSSNFIDTPSGILKLVVRKMSHTNQGNFPLENTILRVSLKSHIGRDRILSYSGTSNIFKESYDTQILSIYKQLNAAPDAKKKTLLLNEVSNFVLRHYSDQLILSLHQISGKSGEEAGDIQLFKTSIELNNLELNQEKMSITVIGTSPMRNKTTNAQLVYYTFELDLLFTVRLQSEPEASAFEVALENYRMMKQQAQGREDVKVTKSEEEVIRMMFERIQIGKKLTPTRIKARRALFTLRNMMRVRYQVGHMNERQRVPMRVNPRTFMMGLGFGVSGVGQLVTRQKKEQYKISMMQEQEMEKEIKDELKRAETQTQSQFKYENLPLEKGSAVEKHNVLAVEIMPYQITSTMNQTQSISQKYKKIVLVATQEQQTVFKKEFNPSLLIGGDQNIFSGTKIFFKSVSNDQALTFRVMAVAANTSASTIKDGAETLQTLGMAIVRIGPLGLRTWNLIEGTFPIQGPSVSSSMQFLKLRFNLLYSEFTRNSSKVINVNFHRVLHMPGIQVREQMASQVNDQQIIPLKNSIIQSPQLGSIASLSACVPQISEYSSEIQLPMIVLKESPICERIGPTGEKMNITTRNLEQGGEAEMPKISASANTGSINEHMLQAAFSGENLPLNSGLVMRMEFDNCVENEGPLIGGDSREYEINTFGKVPQIKTKNLNRVTINNLKHDSVINFKLCMGQATNKTSSGVSECSEIAVASIVLAEMRQMPNQQLNIMIPLRFLSDQDAQMAVWAHKQYKFQPQEEIFVLASLTVTDRTFGELAVHMSKIESIPRQVQIREIQWRMIVVNALGVVQHANGKTPTNQSEGLVSKKLSERIEYDIGSSKQIDIVKTVMVHLQMKDIFNGDLEESLNPRVQQLYQDQDLYIIFELVGFDDTNRLEYVMGEKQISLLQLIQRQYLEEKEKQQSLNSPNKANTFKPQIQKMDTSKLTEIARDRGVESQAQKAADMEFAGCSAKFQALFKSSYVTFSKAKEDIIKNRPDMKEEISQFESKVALKESLPFTGGESPKKQVNKTDVPLGYRVLNLKPHQGLAKETTVTNDVEKLFDQANSSIQRVACYEDNQSPPAIIAKLEFNFSYKRRAQQSKEYLEAQEEQMQLERLRQKKSIGNLISTLYACIDTSQSQLLYKTIKRLAFALATQTPNEVVSIQALMGGDQQEDDEMEFLKNLDPNEGVVQTLSNIEKIIETVSELVKWQLQSPSGPDVGTFMEVMKVVTYLKIICSQPGIKKRSLQRYKDALDTNGLLETLIESYLQRNTFGGSALRSAAFTIDFLNFLGTQISDFPELYFKSLCGVNLDPIITKTLDIDRKNMNLIMAHAKFLDQLAQCLIVRRTVTNSSLTTEVQQKLLQIDTGKVIRAVNEQINNIIDGLEVYKNAFETVAGILCGTGMQIVHEMIIQAKTSKDAQFMITEEDKYVVATILVSILKLLVDLIVSEGATTQFITELKRRLTYELAIAHSFKAETNLYMSFNSATILSLLKSLLDRYAALQDMPISTGKGSLDPYRYFERLRVILEFFATATGQNEAQSSFTLNVFGENNRQVIGKCVRKAREIEQTGLIEVKEDFSTFLENVVRADMEYEDDDVVSGKGAAKENKNSNRQATRDKFFNDKYGQGEKKNNEMQITLSSKKFSLSKIDWLDTIYTTD